MTEAVIVTGAAGGIGAAVCDRLRRDGYLSIGIDQNPSTSADASYQMDLADAEELVRLGRELAEHYPLKAVVHNAAVQPIAGAGETRLDDWMAAVRVNILAVDCLVAATRESLRRCRGSVVVVSSVHGRVTTGGLTAYATTKAALEGWVRSAAIDLGPEVRVNAVVPGAIDTAKLREGFARWGKQSAGERMALLKERTPLQRIGQPEDISGPVSFLIGDDAQFITGAVLVADGGATTLLGTE